MASSINASTTAGVVTTADTSGVLNIQTAGTTAISIDASQNVGVGVTPSAWQSSLGSRAIQFTGSAVYGYRDTNLILTQNAYYDGAYKYYASSIAAGYYGIGAGVHSWYNAPSGTAGNAITFTQVLSVDKAKSLALEGATSQTGTGITFPATQSASSDANTLDDYEEGTFTPSLEGSSVAGTVTYVTDGQVGRYTKIGNRCAFTIWINWSNWTGSPSGSVFVAGLPFPSKSVASNYSAVNVYMDGAYTLNANSVIQGYVNQGVSYVFLGQYTTGGGSAANLGFDTAAALMITGTYETS